MAIRIEIAKLHTGKLELRIGDLSGSSQSYSFTKEEVLSDIGDEIDILLKNQDVPSTLCEYCGKSEKEHRYLAEGKMTKEGLYCDGRTNKMFKPQDVEDTKYVCPNCKENLTEEDMGNQCGNCGHWQYHHLAEVKNAEDTQDEQLEKMNKDYKCFDCNKLLKDCKCKEDRQSEPKKDKLIEFLEKLNKPELNEVQMRSMIVTKLERLKKNTKNFNENKDSKVDVNQDKGVKDE